MNDNHENRVNSNTRLINSTIKLAALLSLHVLEHVFDFIYSVSKKKRNYSRFTRGTPYRGKQFFSKHRSIDSLLTSQSFTLEDVS